MSNPDELKQLIKNAAKLLGIGFNPENDIEYLLCHFNPLDPDRGDLMKVAEAAELVVDHQLCEVLSTYTNDETGLCQMVTHETWKRGNHQSLALAILRAASAVLHSRGGV